MLSTFTAKIGRHLAPFFSFPFHYGIVIVMGDEPMFGAGNDAEELLRLWCERQFGLALALLHPKNGVVTVGVDGLLQSMPLHQSEGMDDGEKLAYVVGAVDGAEMENSLPRGKVYALIFHGARIAAASRIHSPSICADLHRQRQHCVVAVSRGRKHYN